MLEEIYDIFEGATSELNYLATLKLTSRLESGKWELIVLRHVDAPVSADEKENGGFLGPWVPGYNSARRTFAATLRESRGQAPVVPDDHGYNLYELDGRLALKKLTPYQTMNNGRSGKPVWQM